MNIDYFLYGTELYKHYYVVNAYGESKFVLPNYSKVRHDIVCEYSVDNGETITRLINNGKQVGYPLVGEFSRIFINNSQYLYGRKGTKSVIIPLENFPVLMPELIRQPQDREEILNLIKTDIRFLDVINVNTVYTLLRKDAGFFYNIMEAINYCLLNLTEMSLDLVNDNNYSQIKVNSVKLAPVKVDTINFRSTLIGKTISKVQQERIETETSKQKTAEDSDEDNLTKLKTEYFNKAKEIVEEFKNRLLEFAKTNGNIAN